VPAMVDEVSQAITWMFDNAAAYGGDPKQVRCGGVELVVWGEGLGFVGSLATLLCAFLKLAGS